MEENTINPLEQLCRELTPIINKYGFFRISEIELMSFDEFDVKGRNPRTLKYIRPSIFN